MIRVQMKRYNFLITITLLSGYLWSQQRGAFYIGGSIMPQTTSLKLGKDYEQNPYSYLVAELKSWNLGISFGLNTRYFITEKISLSADLMYSTQVQEAEFTHYVRTTSYYGPVSQGDYRVALRVVKLPLHLTTLLGKGPVFFTGLLGFQPHLIVGSRETYKIYSYYGDPPEEVEEINGYIYDVAGTKFTIALSSGFGTDIWVTEKLGVIMQFRTDITFIDIETASLILRRVKGYDSLGFLVGIYYGGR